VGGGKERKERRRRSNPPGRGKWGEGGEGIKEERDFN
jgi:hypothetical protein